MKVTVRSSDNQKVVQITIKKTDKLVDFAIIKNDLLIATANCELKPQEDYMWIDHIIVDPAYRRQGYGSALLKAIEFVTYENMLYDIRGYFGPEDKDTYKSYLRNNFRIESDGYKRIRLSLL